jgi:hypothetical protein
MRIDGSAPLLVVVDGRRRVREWVGGLGAWRATRGGATTIATRQQERLQALVKYARRTSRFYAEHYAAVPSGPIRLRSCISCLQ